MTSNFIRCCIIKQTHSYETLSFSFSYWRVYKIMLKRKGTMVYVDIISIESALNCLDNVIEYCESTCLTDKQIDELIAPAREDTLTVESALSCLDNVIEYCESTCLTDKQIDELIAPAGEAFIPLNCHRSPWRRAGKWIRKKMSSLANRLSCFK